MVKADLERLGFVKKVQPLIIQETFPSAKILIACLFLVGVLCLFSSCTVKPARAEEIKLKASWYSIKSLIKEGTYKKSKGVMANGKRFNENHFTCANRLYPLGSLLRITAIKSGKSVIVKTTDRIGRRFANTRIDLSKGAFAQIANCREGLISCRVERII
jgi:rare lipoprotein A (peptidoglycan hydrolase)